MLRPEGGNPAAVEQPSRRLFVCTGGFLTNQRLRRMLALAGWRVGLGLPGPGDAVGVWGRSPHAGRGEALARWRGACLIRIEDAFLRSVKPGRAGAPPLGLLIDTLGGVHFDASAPSSLETLLASHALADPGLLGRARDGMARLRQADLSKYNMIDPAAPLPTGPFVLVVDQTRGDASIRYSGADDTTFAQMLSMARDENPGARIVIKTHPETASGLRPGHYSAADCDNRTSLLSGNLSPWRLLDRASAVYTVSSQLGFEAILAGHRPSVLGRPFYAGWGLSQDLAAPMPRRGRALTAEQLFAAAYLLAPVWYDPYRDRLTDFETVVDCLEAGARAWREDYPGYAAWGMRLWKRAPLQKVLGRERPILFRAPQQAVPPGRRAIVWANRADQAPVGAIKVEDGFLRSRGLGAQLVPPLSLVLDDLGIYYDPRQESRLERLIRASVDLPAPALARAARLRRAIIAAGLSKYNFGGGDLPDLPKGQRILVPGQVEDDASIQTGTDPAGARTNLALLTAARQANPAAVLIYKPHPDVEAGLRKGQVPAEQALALADLVLSHADPIRLIDQVDEVWTLTSLLGFEALLRGKPVTCLGLPFYAGWSLTRDLGPVSPRRGPGISLDGLTHAVLIGYPRYYDPKTGLAAPAEVAVERLSDPALPRGGPGLRLLAKAQGWLAGYAHLWR